MEKALAAFKENGHPNALWMNTGLKDTGSNFNLSSGYDVSNGYIVKDGTVEYSFVTDSSKDYAMMLNSWWESRYIYSDFITVEGEIEQGLVLNGDIGVWFGANSAAELMVQSSGGELSVAC